MLKKEGRKNDAVKDVEVKEFKALKAIDSVLQHEECGFVLAQDDY